MVFRGNVGTLGLLTESSNEASFDYMVSSIQISNHSVLGKSGSLYDFQSVATHSGEVTIRERI